MFQKLSFLLAYSVCVCKRVIYVVNYNCFFVLHTSKKKKKQILLFFLNL